MSDHVNVDQAALWVAGLEDGDEVVRFRLAHGEDPEHGLQSRGFASLTPERVVGQGRPHQLTLVYSVRRAPGIPVPPAREADRDADLVLVVGETPVPYQRIAVYAVVRSSRGILLSQASGRTNSPGLWGLCGGGVDPEELPEEALHREVWEESSQRIEVTGLAAIRTRHWVGRAPYGRLEDFQAVRIIYRATCADPTDAVVLDEDGTTAASAWVPVDEVADLPLVSGWRPIIVPLVAAHQ